jgi:hypothetical protein
MNLFYKILKFDRIILKAVVKSDRLPLASFTGTKLEPSLKRKRLVEYEY